MKKLLVMLMLMMSMNAMAQKTYKVSKDSTDGGLIFNGTITFNDLENEPSFIWLKNGKMEYRPDEKNLKLLQFYLPQYTMVVFLGTWCDDSHNLIPKLEKVLEYCRYPKTKLTMYGVDRDKTNIGGEYKKYGITNVPTIILFKDNTEVGRITETVKTSIEADLSAIIQQDMEGHQPH